MERKVDHDRDPHGNQRQSFRGGGKHTRDIVFLDIMTLGNAITIERKPDEILEIHECKCDLCGTIINRDDFDGMKCHECGYTMDSKKIDFRDRVAYDSEQLKNRVTQATTTFIVPDKNLGSCIGYGKHYDDRARRLAKTMQFFEENDVREMKVFLRNISFIADSQTLCLTRHEFEHLAIEYRKKFLGKKISMGRSNFVIHAAFAFLELRQMKGREYLSMEEFISKARERDCKEWGDVMQLIDDENDVEGKKRHDKKKDEFRGQFVSAISKFTKDFKYKLVQPPVESIIHHILISILNAMPRLPSLNMVEIDALKLCHIVLPHYKYRGVKFPGIAGAMIYLSFLKNNIKTSMTTISKNTYGVSSTVTVKDRVKEIKGLLEKQRIALSSNMKRLLEDGCGESDDAVACRGEMDFISEFIDHRRDTPEPHRKSPNPRQPEIHQNLP